MAATDVDGLSLGEGPTCETPGCGKDRVGAQSRGPTSRQYRFRRNSQGRIDPHGDLLPEQSYIKMKFEGESRFLFGCGIVEKPDGTREGKRCKAFKYSGKWIVTIAERNQLRAREIARVRSLSESAAPWVTGHREIHTGFFMEDPISVLPRVGKVLEHKLAAIGIHTVGDVKELSNQAIQEICATVTGTTAKSLFNLRRVASQASIGANVSQLTDHKRAANPYLSLYGENWEDQIDKSLTLRRSVCVTILIQHIVDETKLLLKDTKLENAAYFYHDALSQMTCDETITWMKTNDLYRYWLLPKMGLNDDTPYAGRPVGNSPEMMPWDCSLNKDVDDSFQMHVALTKSLPADDPLKFSRSTPNRQDNGYLRLVDPIHGTKGGVPSSARIIQDVTKCAKSHLLAIIAAKGAIVPGLGSRNGHRRAAEISNRGGHRTKKAYNQDEWIHPDAQAARAKISRLAAARFLCSKQLIWGRNVRGAGERRDGRAVGKAQSRPQS